METTTISTIHALGYRESRTYMLAALFIAGNIVLPQLCHLIPRGGLIWLPIYFFTLIAAYRYGVVAGMLTAVLSPVVNSLCFGMPAAAALPVILFKSVALALAASFIASRTGRVTFLAVATAVVAYQTLGMAAEWLITSSFAAALQDIRLGWPGILAQAFGGYAVMKYFIRK